MSIVEQIIWYVTDVAFLALVAAVIMGFFLAWGIAAILCRTSDFGAQGCFSAEVAGYRAWGIAFIIYAVGIVILGAVFFLMVGSHWSLVVPYVVVIIVSIVLCLVLNGRAEKMARVSR